MNPSALEAPRELATLTHLNEPSVLHALKTRYIQKKIYTYSGIALIAINPFEPLGIYGMETIERYMGVGVTKSVKLVTGEEDDEEDEGEQLEELDPHLFAIAKDAYMAMTQDRKGQTIIVSGESGAGKTETAKYIMRYMAAVNAVNSDGTMTALSTPSPSQPTFPSTLAPPSPDAPSSRFSLMIKGTSSTLTSSRPSIEQQILATNPILEAFGNAKTARNNNSSRFGKYIQILFDEASPSTSSASPITPRFTSGRDTHPAHSLTKSKSKSDLSSPHPRRTSRLSSAPPKITITGARIRTYLLERSRVVFQHGTGGEQNYHIFYQLCAGATSSTSSSTPNHPSPSTPESATVEDDLDLGLGPHKRFHYLNSTSSVSSLAVGAGSSIRWDEYAKDFAATRRALETVGIRKERQRGIFRLVAAILHLGNVEIVQKRDVAMIPDEDEAFERVVQLLGISPSTTTSSSTRPSQSEGAKLFKKWLLNRQISTPQRQQSKSGAGGETFVKGLNKDQAVNARDGLAKWLYACLFEWLVGVVNSSLTEEDRDDEKDLDREMFIGVLDIYGFEHFEQNFFEQFCINYANEKLQQQFTAHIFKLEQDTYEEEGIPWSFVEFVDNKKCVEVIESRYPHPGILALLDEECRLPSTTDISFCQKLNDLLGAGPAAEVFKGVFNPVRGLAPSIGPPPPIPPSNLIPPRPTTPTSTPAIHLRPTTPTAHHNASHGHTHGHGQNHGPNLISSTRQTNLHANTAFTIAHYAADVTYRVDGFLEKNRGVVPDEQVEVLRRWGGDLVKEVVGEGVGEGREGGLIPGKAVEKDKEGGKGVNGNGHVGIGAKTAVVTSGQRKPTQCTLFKHSLNALMEMLYSTRIHYIRCVKPNNDKLPWLFDSAHVLAQLRACGVLETIRISAAGYPSRWSYEEFRERYSLFLPENEQRRLATDPSSLGTRELCERILQMTLPDEDPTPNADPHVKASVPSHHGSSKLYQLGKTKLFFRVRTLALLEGLRTRLLVEQQERREHAAMEIQRVVKGWIARRIYAEMVRQWRWAVGLECAARSWLARNVLKGLQEQKRVREEQEQERQRLIVEQTEREKAEKERAETEKPGAAMATAVSSSPPPLPPKSSSRPKGGSSGISNGASRHIDDHKSSQGISQGKTNTDTPRSSSRTSRARTPSRVRTPTSRPQSPSGEMRSAMLNLLHPSPSLDLHLGSVPTTPSRGRTTNYQSPTASSSTRVSSRPPSRSQSRAPTRTQSRPTSPVATPSKTRNRLKKLAFYKHGASKSVDTRKMPEPDVFSEREEEATDVSTPLPELKIYNQFMRGREGGASILNLKPRWKY